MYKSYKFKHSVKDDQIIRPKLQISILLILEMVLHVTWNGAYVDANNWENSVVRTRNYTFVVSVSAIDFSKHSPFRR
jgi:hypothetical protein